MALPQSAYAVPETQASSPRKGLGLGDRWEK